MIKKILISTLLLSNCMFAEKIYYNGNVLDSNKLFRDLSSTNLQNANWNQDDYNPYLYNKYHDNSKSFKSLISYKDFLDKETSKLKFDYLFVFSSGKSKKTFIDLYLEVFNKSLDTIVLELNNFKRPLYYNDMILYTLENSNNPDIYELKNTSVSLMYIFKHYKLFNYSGKIHALNKIEIILKEIEITPEIELELYAIKPNFKEATEIELILHYSSLINELSKKDVKVKINAFKNVEYANNIIELVSSFYSNNLSKEDYILLMRKIEKESYHFTDFLVESDYLENLLKYIQEAINSLT